MLGSVGFEFIISEFKILYGKFKEKTYRKERHEGRRSEEGLHVLLKPDVDSGWKTLSSLQVTRQSILYVVLLYLRGIPKIDQDARSGGGAGEEIRFCSTTIRRPRRSQRQRHVADKHLYMRPPRGGQRRTRPRGGAAEPAGRGRKRAGRLRGDCGRRNAHVTAHNRATGSTVGTRRPEEVRTRNARGPRGQGRRPRAEASGFRRAEAAPGGLTRARRTGLMNASWCSLMIWLRSPAVEDLAGSTLTAASRDNRAILPRLSRGGRGGPHFCCCTALRRRMSETRAKGREGAEGTVPEARHISQTAPPAISTVGGYTTQHEQQQLQDKPPCQWKPGSGDALRYVRSTGALAGGATRRRRPGSSGNSPQGTQQTRTRRGGSPRADGTPVATPSAHLFREARPGRTATCRRPPRCRLGGEAVSPGTRGEAFVTQGFGGPGKPGSLVGSRGGGKRSPRSGPRPGSGPSGRLHFSPHGQVWKRRPGQRPRGPRGQGSAACDHSASGPLAWGVMDQVMQFVEPSRQFVKDSIRLVKRCTKPDRKEFQKIAMATAIGFAIMGFIGFFVKLIHIPINNIIVFVTLLGHLMAMSK
ncbi:hypothetical protein HPG69_012151 [Diceros bicornis minor]|uniref:Protein transport protein Sec61 subunit gamma n=1 Tax=Diceros bicornis minor TaxID=77932 RepID=A0A7J7ELX4_DICBM|nr:hypothetical protein HPG69_012151 [Diceros bicornis minor]